MEVEKITWDNFDKYKELFPKITNENVVRDSYKALGAVGKKGKAAIVWEVITEPGAEKKCVEVKYIKDDDRQAFKAILKECKKRLDKEGAEIFFELREIPGTDLAADLEAQGYHVTRGKGHDVIITVSDMVNVTYKYRNLVPDYVKNLGELTFRELGRGIRKCLYYGHVGTLYDLDTLPMSYYEMNVSCCVYINKEVTGLFLVHKNVEGDLELALMAGFTEDPACIMYMMCFAAFQMERIYDEKTRIIIRRHNVLTEKMTDKLFPKAKTVNVAKGGKAKK